MKYMGTESGRITGSAKSNVLREVNRKQFEKQIKASAMVGGRPLEELEAELGEAIISKEGIHDSIIYTIDMAKVELRLLKLFAGNYNLEIDIRRNRLMEFV